MPATSNTTTQRALTPQEAVSASLNLKGCIDMPYLQTLTQMSMEDLYEALRGEIFLTSEDYRTLVWQHKSELLCGNVVEKYLVAKETYEDRVKGQFERIAVQDTLDALMAVRPQRIAYNDIDIQLGARWLPTVYFEQFFRYVYEVRYNGVCKVDYLESVDLFTTDIRAFGESTWKYITASDDINAISQYALADNVPMFSKTEDGETCRDIDRHRQVQKIVAELRAEFVAFMHSDAITEQQRDIIELIYNNRFNCFVRGSFDGTFQTFPGLDYSQFPFSDLYRAQKDCIWMLKMLNGGVGYLPVGAGKTMIMCVAAYEMHRTGMARKPMIIGMKANVSQIAETFRKAYPSAKLLYPTDADFNRENREKLFRKMADEDWDCIIMSHDQFGKIPQDVQTEIRIIEQELADLKRDRDIVNEHTVIDLAIDKMLETKICRLEDRLFLLNVKRRSGNDSLTFHDIFIDHIFVDEYHIFKNLQFSTSHGRAAGLGNTSGSDKAWNLLIAIRDMQMRRGTDMCASFFSGTVISNAITELYVLFKYLRPNAMRQQHLTCFDAWAGNYAHKSTDYDLSITGNIIAKESFRSYCNVPELSAFFSEITDYRSADAMNIDRPKANVIFDSQEPTSTQMALIERLCSFAQSGRWEDLGFGHEVQKPVNLETSVMLIATDLARKVSLDPRMISTRLFADEAGNKASRCAMKVAEYYRKYDEQKGTQFVFCDISTFAAGKWNIYSDIKQKLVQMGIPEREIAFIHQYNTDKKRLALFDKMNNGEVRVLFGSTQKLGTGVNAQRRAVAVHHLDIPWRPSDLEQRNGRAVRSGNLVKEWGGNQVDIIIYGTTHTLDAYKFALLRSKEQFIKQINAGTVGVRNIGEDTITEDGGMNFAEYVAILSGNDDLIRKARLESRIAELKQASSADGSQHTEQAELYALNRELEALIEKIDNDIYEREQAREKAMKARAEERNEANISQPINISNKMETEQTATRDYHWYTETVNLLKKYDHAYFVESKPIVTDTVYDEYYFAVQQYEQAHPEQILPDSPTQQVGADGSNGKRTIRHRTPMMSTQKCKSVADVIKWMRSTRKAAGKKLSAGETLGDNPFSIEWKYDGCSCSLVYVDGILVEASTRGDYMNGQDILQHVKLIPGIPQVLRPGHRLMYDGELWEPLAGDDVVMGRVEVRGEVLMSYANLEKTNGLYKDCRTAASAILNTEKVTPHDSLLTFRAWQMITEPACGNQGIPFIGKDDDCLASLNVLRNVLGFEVDTYSVLDEGMADIIIEGLTEQRGLLPYPVDGLVIKLNNKRIWDAMGKTEHHPKFCIAYKFAPQTAETTITKIEITVGATGKRTPIIWFEPVYMNGKTYEKASGGSEDTVAKNGFAVGKRVQFSLANDVIPHIDKVIE